MRHEDILGEITSEIRSLKPKGPEGWCSINSLIIKVEEYGEEIKKMAHAEGFEEGFDAGLEEVIALRDMILKLAEKFETLYSKRIEKLELKLPERVKCPECDGTDLKRKMDSPTKAEYECLNCGEVIKI